MKKKVGKRQIAFILVAICLVGLIGIGISYSYYLANISTSNEENKNSNISTTTITQVVMDMQGKISRYGAYPGHKMVKEVVVRGIGSDDATPANASIQITPDLGDFADDVTWKLYKSDTPITCTSTEHTDGEKYYEEASSNIPSSATLELQGGAIKDRTACLARELYKWYSPEFKNCERNNYLYKSDNNQWTIAPYSDRAYNVFYVSLSGGVNNYVAYNVDSVRPTLFLKSNISLNEGKGSLEEPYQLRIN